MSALSSCFLQCCLCHAGFVFVFLPWSLPVTRSAIVLWSSEPAWKDVSFVIATIVRCCPSLYKTRATHSHPQDVPLSLGRSPYAGKGWVTYGVTHGPRIDLKRCRDVGEVWDSRTWEIFPCAVLTGLKIQSDLSVEPPDRSCNLWATQSPASHQLRGAELMEAGSEGCCFPSKYLWGHQSTLGFSLWRKKFFFLSGYLERHHAIYGGLLNSESPWEVWLKDHFRKLTWWSSFWDFAFQRGWCGFDPWSGSWNPTCLGAIEAKHKQRQCCGKFNEEF